MIDRLLYSRKEAAEKLSLSLSSIEIMIARGIIRTRRQGRRVLIPRAEIERVAKQDIGRIWPKRSDGGKTTRRLEQAAEKQMALGL